MDFPRVVYVLQHVPTGKVYVGSTHNIYERISVHISNLKRGKHNVAAMQEDYNRYGGPYTVRIMDAIYGMDDRNKEHLWMDALRARDPEYGYNMNDSTVKSAIADVAWILFPMESGEDRDLAKKALREEFDRVTKQ